MNTEDARTDLGIIRIHKNVVASIATLAACEIEGVKRVGGDLKSNLLQLIGQKALSAIKVEFDKNEEVKLEIPIVIKYGYNIPEIANRVQENIRQAMEKMTNLVIKDINVAVQAVEKE